MRAVTPLRAVVLLSGGGTTMANLHEQSRQGVCAVRIMGVLASRPGAYGLQRAKALGLPTQVVARRDFTDARAFSRQVFMKINALKPDVVLLAGFTSLLLLPDRWLGRTLNIHPALLPRFGGKGMYGHHVHEAVLASGVKESGATVHFVDNQYDHGPIIVQARVPVMEGDTPDVLQQRVQLVEREIYPEAVNMLADGRVRYENGEAVFTSL